jgi:Holliday junction resolvasome RuvABC DNA-binding subunit
VGKKMSERIALELRDKVDQVGIESKTAPVQVVTEENERTRKDALSALQNLGYTPKAARRAIEKALALVKEDDLEGLIRKSLKLLVS